MASDKVNEPVSDLQAGLEEASTPLWAGVPLRDGRRSSGGMQTRMSTDMESMAGAVHTLRAPTDAPSLFSLFSIAYIGIVMVHNAKYRAKMR
jgi:hypothetical protein